VLLFCPGGGAAAALPLLGLLCRGCRPPWRSTCWWVTMLPAQPELGGGGGSGRGRGGDAWLVWQLVDSGFPTGGFAHSLGLEACAALGLVAAGECRGPGERQQQQQHGDEGMPLTAFARAQLRSIAASELPFVFSAHAAAAALPPQAALERWAALDRQNAARLAANAAATAASMAQGKSLLRVTTTQGLAAMTGDPVSATARCEVLASFEASVHSGACRGMLAPAFGAVTA
jgi:urease accessory protein UreF